MNITTSEPSLYQLTQDLDEPLVPQSVGAETLKSYVSNIIDLLIEEQLEATIWVKLPQTKSWLNQIQRLQKEGNVKNIFVCSSQRDCAPTQKGISKCPRGYRSAYIPLGTPLGKDTLKGSAVRESRRLGRDAQRTCPHIATPGCAQAQGFAQSVAEREAELLQSLSETMAHQRRTCPDRGCGLSIDEDDTGLPPLPPSGASARRSLRQALPACSEETSHLADCFTTSHKASAAQCAQSEGRTTLKGRRHRSFPALYNDGGKAVIPLMFNQSSILQRECCLIVAAPGFCSLVLAQWQKSKIQVDASGKRLQQPYLKMVSSFSASEINAVLSGIKQNIVADNDRGKNAFSFDSSVAIRTDLLSKLIFRQVGQHEKVQSALNVFHSKTDRQPEVVSTPLGLQSSFLNDLVQELRSPITHMKTALSLLESKQIKGEQRQRYLQMVSNQCDRQNSLVNGLLGLLQLNIPAKTEYLHLDDLVPGIVSTYQPLAEEKDIQLGYTIPANLPPISCPKSWFRQIIINLLNNSLQFTPPKGRVFVRASYKKESQQIEILVADTGVGISNKDINRIFDGFYRTKPTDKSQVAGAGLGLTLVKQSIQRSGGSVFVTSKLNKGTTFKILMPAVPTELIAASSS